MVQPTINTRGQCHSCANLEIRVLSSFFSGKVQGNFSLVLQGGPRLHIKMGTLHSCQVFGTPGYGTGKCRRCDKIWCNRCPLVIGKTSVYTELLVPLRVIATLETNTLSLLSFSFMRDRWEKNERDRPLSYARFLTPFFSLLIVFCYLLPCIPNFKEYL